MRTDARRVLLVTVVVTLAGCAGSGGNDGDDAGGGTGCVPPATASVSFAGNIQPIFTRSCAVSGLCHVGAAPAGGYDLSAGRAYDASVNVDSTERRLKRVRPGEPDESYTFLKITASPPDIAGDFMPQGCPSSPREGAAFLSADEIEAIRTWIVECALDN